MVEARHAISATASPQTGEPTGAAAAPSLFHRVLSELNPLQYLPVIGTIYRAVTGDTIPETARLAGSAVVSFLCGGPVGLAMNLGTTAIERLVGVDPEQIGQHLLAAAGIGPSPLASPGPEPSRGAPEPRQPAILAWSQSQLGAYRAACALAPSCRDGAEIDADALNALELARLHGGRLALVA